MGKAAKRAKEKNILQSWPLKTPNNLFQNTLKGFLHGQRKLKKAVENNVKRC